MSGASTFGRGVSTTECSIGGGGGGCWDAAGVGGAVIGVEGAEASGGTEASVGEGVTIATFHMNGSACGAK